MTDMWSDLVWTAIHNITARMMFIFPGLLAMATLAAVGLVVGWAMGRLARTHLRVAIQPP